MISLSRFIAFHARRTPDRCALKHRGEDISYGQFDDRIRRIGGWLISSRIGPGDIVAVPMKNSAAFLELAFATSHIGTVFLPINYRLSADEVDYIVGNSGARILIADEELAGIATGGAPVTQFTEAVQSNASLLASKVTPAPMHVRLAEHCRARLVGLINRDSLPRNPSGKVLKRVLRAELET